MSDHCRNGEANAEGGPVLNVNAAAFVPQGVANANLTPLQFGDLPDSLNPSPHLSTREHLEWPGKPANGYPTPPVTLTGENSDISDQATPPPPNPLSPPSHTKRGYQPRDIQYFLSESQIDFVPPPPKPPRGPP